MERSPCEDFFSSLFRRLICLPSSAFSASHATRNSSFSCVSLAFSSSSSLSTSRSISSTSVFSFALVCSFSTRIASSASLRDALRSALAFFNASPCASNSLDRRETSASSAVLVSAPTPPPSSCLSPPRTPRRSRASRNRSNNFFLSASKSPTVRRSEDTSSSPPGPKSKRRSSSLFLLRRPSSSTCNSVDDDDDDDEECSPMETCAARATWSSCNDSSLPRRASASDGANSDSSDKDLSTSASRSSIRFDRFVRKIAACDLLMNCNRWTCACASRSDSAT
mmetsp:Transcript_31191/g.90665  ORF Transcript_31191/g.90665 Transcript_31191/m.90665 type:complete len:281 (-) Transcript_31191:126-968(-)